MNKITGKDADDVEDDIYYSLLDMAKGLEAVDLEYLIDNTKSIYKKEAFIAAAEFMTCMKEVIKN